MCQARRGLQAIELFDNAIGGPPVLFRHGNGIRPDRVRMLVDGSGATPINIERISGRTIQFAASTNQRTPGARSLTLSEAQYRSAFQVGRFLYVVAPSGESDLVPIEGLRYDRGGSTVRVSEQLCPTARGSSMAARCFGGGCLGTPVELVEYAVIDDEDIEAKTDLVRRTVDARSRRDILPNSTLVIAEYVVNLQVWGTYDTRNALAVGGNLPVIPRTLIRQTLSEIRELVAWQLTMRGML